jgi:hypothetical protein
VTGCFIGLRPRSHCRRDRLRGTLRGVEEVDPKETEMKTTAWIVMTGIVGVLLALAPAALA